MGNTNVNIDEKGARFQNKSANELEFDLECNSYSDKERDLGLKRFRIKEKVPLLKQLKKIKQNKNGKRNLYKVYEQGLVVAFYYKKKSVMKQEEEEYKLYNIQVLYQYSHDLSLISNTKAQPRTSKVLDLKDTNANSSYPLSKVPSDCSFS